MRKKMMQILAALALLMIGVMSLWSCGEYDPAEAPSDGIIEIVQAAEGEVITETWGVSEDLKVPVSCTDVYLASLVDHCVSDPASVTSCTAYAADEDTMQACCEANFLELSDTIKDAYRNRLRPGDCGHGEVILTAVVYRGGAGGTSFSEKDTYNGMEVRWKTIGLRSDTCDYGVEMWGVDEIPCISWPTSLAEPYMDETDDRGLSEIKLRWPIPITPGTTVTYGAAADIGYDSASYSIEITVDELTEDTGDDDDETTV